MKTTTIKVMEETALRLKLLALSKKNTINGAIEELLDEYDKGRLGVGGDEEIRRILMENEKRLLQLIKLIKEAV